MNVYSIKDLYFIDYFINNLPYCVFWKDKNLVFQGCNKLFAQQFGYDDPKQVVGKTDKDFPWPNALRNKYIADDKEILASGKAKLDYEEQQVQKDGSVKTVLVSKIPICDEIGDIIGILGIYTDITERKNVEENLKIALQKSELANKAKTEFLENMRHDIRTPLTGIVGFAKLIKTEAKDANIREYSDNLIAASQMLLEFLNGILEAVKVLTGEMPTVKKKISLRDLIDKIIQLEKPKAIEKQLKISLRYSSKIPKYVIADPARIQRILLELISNALNFTHQGGVSINVTLAKKQRREAVIKFVVKDTGIGIPANKQEEIFLRFKRLTPSYKGIYKGAGLGLTIVKEFIDHLDGEIYCQSTESKGTTFTCLIPLQEALLDDASGISKFDANITHGKNKISKDKIKKNTSCSKTKILIVEDNPIAAQIARSIIEELDCTADIASDGEEALSCFSKHQYDLIFMDVGLPGISGNDLTKQIRTQEWPLDQHIPIIALTAHVDSENKQECIEAGMDAVLSKPLVYDTAKDVINAFLPKCHAAKKADLLKVEDKAIDLEAGMEKLNCDADKATKMIVALIDDFQKELPNFIAAKQKGDWNTIKELVHKQRGGSAYCGTPGFHTACARLDDYLKAKETKLRDKLYQQMLDEMEKVTADFKGKIR